MAYDSEAPDTLRRDADGTRMTRTCHEEESRMNRHASHGRNRTLARRFAPSLAAIGLVVALTALGIAATAAETWQPPPLPSALQFVLDPRTAEGEPVLVQPIDVALAADGGLYVLDQATSRVYHVAPSGALLDAWGERGSGEGQATGPAALAVAPPGSPAAGDVFVADAWGARILRFKPDGRFAGAPVTGGTAENQLGRQLAGLAIAADGTLAVADREKFRVATFDPDGRFLGAWGGRGTGRSQFEQVGVLEFAADGTLWAADYNVSGGRDGIRRFRLDGTLLDRRGGLSTLPGRLWGPNGLAIGRASEVFVSDSNNQRIQRFAAHGQFFGLWGQAGEAPGDFSGPGGLAVDAGDRLWVADVLNKRVEVFGPRVPEGWRTEIFPNPDLAGWATVVTDTPRAALAAGIDWGEGPLAPGLPADGASARYSLQTMTYHAPQRLTLAARGGLRVWMDAEQVLDAWDQAATDQAIELTPQTDLTTIRVALRDAAGPAALRVALDPLAAPTFDPSATPTPFPTPTATLTPLPTPTSARLGLIHLPWLGKGEAPAATPVPTPAWLGNPAIDVDAYALRLVAPRLGEADAQARAVVTFTALAALDRLVLDIEPRAIAVNRVTTSGAPPGTTSPAALAYAILSGEGGNARLSGAKLSIALGRTLAPGTRSAVVIDYSLRRADFAAPEGFRYDDFYYGSRMFTTLNWPYYTRYWLPSNDDPADPATIAFELHVPSDVVAGANGRLVEGSYTGGSGLDGDGLRVFRWRLDQPVPTYDFNIVVGEFGVYTEDICFDIGTPSRERVPCDRAEHRVPLVIYYPASRPGVSAATLQQIELAADAMIYYSSALGPYPYDKIGYVLAPHPFNMEYASLITLVSAGSAVHELLHHWWGDPLWIGSWGDFWISEGFTTYFTGFFDEVVSGTNTACRMRSGRLSNPPDTDPLTIFDSTAYCKGAAAIHDLRLRMAALAGREIGDPAAKSLFLAAMRDVHHAFNQRHMTKDALVGHLRERLPVLYREAGLGATPAEVDALIDAWHHQWFVLPDAEDAQVVARWDGGSATYLALEDNTWLPQLAAVGPVEAPLAFDPLGCDAAAPPDPNLAGKIALVERGTCFDVVKIRHAAASGALGVVIYTNQYPKAAPDCSFAPVCANPPQIPAVMIDNAAGLALRERLEGGTAVTARMERYAGP